MPSQAVLEATTACNLECPLCPTHYVPRRSKFLDLDQVKELLRACGSKLKGVCFHIQGEPTLHPRLFELVGHCHEQGVLTTFGTNGMTLGRNLDAVFESGLDCISIDIDGVNAEDYGKYRKRGDFQRVVQNTRALIEERQRRGLAKPTIKLQTIMFTYNEDKERAVVEFLDSFGADQTVLKSPSYFHDIEVGKRHGMQISEAVQGRADRAAAQFLELVDERDESRKYARPRVQDQRRLYRNKPLCPQLRRGTVLSDGRVVACCMDGIGMTTFGDLGKQSFTDIWRGKRHREVVERFLERRLELCKTCTLAD